MVQDELSRFKTGHGLNKGPVNEDAVVSYLERTFAEHGPPLVMKHDRGSIFHGEKVRQLLDVHLVTDLTGPPRYPQYNGKQERSMRDIKRYERAMRRHGVCEPLRLRIDVADPSIRDSSAHRFVWFSRGA